MADASAKSISLPASMLEALGEYRQALKDTKAEIRELEREAKRAEKSGAPVDASARDRRLMLGARAERLENLVQRRRNETAAAREALNQSYLGQRGILSQYGSMAQARGQMLANSLKDASIRLRGAGMGRASALLGRLSGAATKGTEALTQAMATKGFAAAAGAAGIIAAGAYVVGKSVDLKRQMTAARVQGAAGDARVADLINRFSQESAFGGGSSKIDEFVTSVRNPERMGAQIGAAASISDRIMAWSNSGYSTTANNLSTKLAEAEAVRRSAIDKFGAAYGRSLQRDEILRRRGVQIAAARDKKYSTLSGVATWAARGVGAVNREDVVSGVDLLRYALGTYSPPALLVNWAWSGAEAAELEETLAQVTMEHDKAQQQERIDNMRAYQESLQFAVQRAKAHVRSSATQAFEQDKLSRAVTWRMQ